MTVNDIVSKDWALSINSFGSVVQGINDVIQCINIIFTTQKKSDPFRPDFGIDLLSWLDKPINATAAGVISEMIAGLVYEPRMTVTAIVSKIQPSSIIFNVQGFVSDSILAQGNQPAPIDITFVLLTETGELILTEDGNAFII